MVWMARDPKAGDVVAVEDETSLWVWLAAGELSLEHVGPGVPMLVINQYPVSIEVALPDGRRGTIMNKRTLMFVCNPPESGV